ncbi:unnamed protein product [Boreogadus saida]
MEKNQASLSAILAHSPFNTEEELLTELHAIESTSGTKIIIWNLRRTSEEITELDCTTENDIRIPCDDLETSISESNSSLSAYCSILYLEPSMLINIQGQRVEKHRIHESLHYIDRSHSYKPNIVKKKIPITFGRNESKQHYGLMMYYNNRLIKPYHRVGCQLDDKNRKGVGVIGVFECNHLTPTHNKQDFEDTITYRVLKLSFDHDNTTSTPTTPQTSGEGPSGTKRPRRNCDKGESEMHISPRSSTALTRENVEITIERELLVSRLTQEKQDKAAQIDEQHIKVEQLEEEKDSISEDCEQNKASPETQMQGPRVKDEKKMNSSTAANDGAQVRAKAMISIIQDQQVQLMELLQSVSNERDSFKEKVKELHAQLELEKQSADCQTAREKAEKLSREKEDLTCRLDQSSKEMEKLHLKVC